MAIENINIESQPASENIEAKPKVNKKIDNVNPIDLRIEKLIKEIELLKTAQIQGTIKEDLFSEGYFKGQKLKIKEDQLSYLHSNGATFISIKGNEVFTQKVKDGKWYKTLDVINELTSKQIAEEISDDDHLDYYIALAGTTRKELAKAIKNN